MKHSVSDIVRGKFRSALDEFHMLDSSRGVLVGFSGGADSSALLYLMADECRRRGIFLKAVHIHHGIRGAEADRDARFCESVCAALGVELELVRADIPLFGVRAHTQLGRASRCGRDGTQL